MTGSLSLPDPVCSANVVVSINGSGSNGIFTLTGSSPPPADACGNPIQANPPFTFSVNLSSCSSGVQTFASGLSGSSYRKSLVAPGTLVWTRNTAPPGLKITLDIAANQLTAVLSGPSSQQGNLSVTYNNGASITTVGGLHPGSYSYPAKVHTLAAGQYSSVNASWANSSLSVPVSFRVSPLTRFSTYNVSSEASCTAPATPVYVFENDATCTYHYGSNFKQDFVSFVNLNGTGDSGEFGYVKPYGVTYLGKNVCNLPPNATSANTFVKIKDITGSCNSTVYSGQSLAVNPNPNPDGNNSNYLCGDKVLIMGLGGQANSVRAVQDYCPVCNTGFGSTQGHIDSFDTTNKSCAASSFTDLTFRSG